VGLWRKLKREIVAFKYEKVHKRKSAEEKRKFKSQGKKWEQVENNFVLMKKLRKIQNLVPVVHFCEVCVWWMNFSIKITSEIGVFLFGFFPQVAFCEL